MKAVLQRVRSARVVVGSSVVARIDAGLLVYVGVAVDDTETEARRLAEKIAALRIFEDEAGKLNRSVRDVDAGVLVVPNFTLQADARKGRRPAFVNAARCDHARPLCDLVAACLADLGCRVATGLFGEHMLIDSQADGPVNIILDMPPAPRDEKGPASQDDTART